VPYDESLAERIRAALAAYGPHSKKKMFGGLAFLVRGNMVCGVVKGEMMARVGPDAYAAALGSPGARPMDFTGRPMTGIVFVGPDGTGTDAGLVAWVARAYAYAGLLPPKGTR
jgi:hypothetical protein